MLDGSVFMFWGFFLAYSTILDHCYIPSIWTRLFGPVYLDLFIWTHLFWTRNFVPPKHKLNKRSSYYDGDQ